MRRALVICWIVTGTAIRVIDGDTFEARLQVWHGIDAQDKVRVLGIDTPELKGAEAARAEAAKSFTDGWLARGLFVIGTCRRDSFGRVLGTVRRPDRGEDLGEELVRAGLARRMVR